MKTNRKFSVNEHNLNGLCEIGSFFVRSCFAAILLVLVLFAGSVVAREIDKSIDLKVFFPQRPLPASREDAYKTMLALGRGRLVLKNGCLRVKSTNKDDGILLIWPGRYGLEIKNRNLIIKDVYEGKEPEVWIKLNSEVILTGGAIPEIGELVRPLPKDCKGPYWFVGGVEPAPKGKKRHRR